jgi:cytochrome c peroxidase
LPDKAKAAGLEAILYNMPGVTDNPLTYGKIELGKMLFFDPRLSSSSARAAPPVTRA